MITRRDLLLSSFGTVLCSSLCRSVFADSPEKESRVFPVRKLTRGPGFHWRGYYDRLLSDPNDRFLVCVESPMENRLANEDDAVKTQLIDLEDNDRIIELGTSRTWSWQQGSLLQWIPRSETDVIWNDREKDRFVSHRVNTKTGEKTTLPNPVFGLAPDEPWAIFPDFRRMYTTRPECGYAGVPDPNAGIAAPENAGIWKMNLDSGKTDLIVPLSRMLEIPEGVKFKEGSIHWYNHLTVAPGSKRFAFLHRWREKKGGGFITRLFTANPDGNDLFLLNPSRYTSHFVWIDDRRIAAWAEHPETKKRGYFVFTDKNDNVEPLAGGDLRENGHHTYVPGTAERWLLNDTYPNRERNQSLYLYDFPTRRRIVLGHFLSPPEYKGYWRCDLHPTAGRQGKWVSFDSPHAGDGRQIFLVDIRELELDTI